ncbi:hypothetical protein [uncultured Tessaracoccus sp.]|uniref:hypothetical protein n=1 Tax=uncultured Tessaracoccus sp. TaxID=905023 RepID=UPI0025E6DFD7|nr:hypothetical protein [uncultured Tessaracoccus sp.]
MRRVLAGAALLALTACGGQPPEPAPSTPDEGAPPSSPGAAPSATPSASAPAAPATTPHVAGAWHEGPGLLADQEAITAATLPAGLKTYLQDAVYEVVDLNSEYDEEFPDCPVEAEVGGVHDAGFAVVRVAGCGPEELTGVVADEDGTWEIVVETVPEDPECTELAEAGVPAGAPFPGDSGLRCVEGERTRYW